ncbi:MAG: OmpW family protein [Gammaproteobacteria bacterium]
MRIYLFTCLLFFSLLMPTSFCMAYDKGTWFARIGPALIEPNDSSNDVEGLANTGVRVDNNITLGFTIGYMLTSKYAVELLGVTPSKHDLRGKDGISALGKIADVDVFPPTLSFQYHFDGSSKFHPYIGVGINYTYFPDEHVTSSLENALGGNTKLDIDDSWGLAAQIGMDYSLNDKWFINSALWYVDIDADATLKTNGMSRDIDIDIDPWVLFAGIGRKF